jgi:hypothetical protein
LRKRLISPSVVFRLMAADSKKTDVRVKILVILAAAKRQDKGY